MKQMQNRQVSATSTALERFTNTHIQHAAKCFSTIDIHVTYMITKTKLCASSKNAFSWAVGGQLMLELLMSGTKPA